MARLSFRCDDELVRRVDAERGLVARETWLRAVVEAATFGPVGRRASEQALSEAKESLDREQADPGLRTPGEGRSAAPAEQPWDNFSACGAPDSAAHVAANQEFQSRVRRSSAARRDVRPVPKGGK